MSLRPHITFLTRLATFLPLFATIAAFGQQSAGTFRIAGSVTDYATGEPVVGANVVAYDAGGRPHGAAVGADGRFAFNCPTKAATLRVSMLGYRNETVKLVPGRTDYDIRLREAPSDVGEVVVTGFVDKKRESYTGATHVIQRQEIENMVHTNVLNIIQLQTPGFEIFDDIANGSDPNKIPDMVLRGRSSFIEGDQTNVPLFILDGTEVDISYVFDMPSDDIESISVLKDASATSFYGSKAANGVVVITTRPTQAGRLQVNYSGNFQVSIPDLSDYRLLNAREKLEYERQAGVYGDFTGSNNTDVTNQKSYYEKLDRVNAGVNTDWKRMALRTGFNHIHNLMLSGGSQDFRYNVSGSYNSTTGVMDESDKQTASLRINLTYGDMNKLFFQNIASLTQSDSNDVPYGSFSDYVSLNPYDRPYNDDGSLNSVLSFNTANPLYEKSLSSYIRNTSGSFIDTFRVRWNILKGLRVEASLSYTQTKSEGETFCSPLSQQFNNTIDANKKGSFDVSNGTTHNLSGNAFAVYNKAWNRRGGDASDLLSLTAGFNIESTRSESHSFSALGILSDKLEHPSMATGYAESRPGGSEDRSRMLGFYVNANYIWHNRYFIDLSFRYEGSSKFGADNKYAPFGSLGLGWNLHKERFLKGSAVSLLKLRMSMGYVGNAGFSPYQAQLAYQYSSSLQYNGGIGAVPVSMVNPRLKWERSLKRNLGLDFGLWRDRLNGSVDVYYDTTNDLVMDISKPAHIGFTSAKENLGKIRNSGIEHESEPLPQSEPQPQPDRRDQRLPEKQERRERSQRHLVASGRLLRRRRVDDGTQSDALGGNQSGQRQGGLHRPRRQSHLRIRLPRQVRRGRHDPRRTGIVRTLDELALVRPLDEFRLPARREHLQPDPRHEGRGRLPDLQRRPASILRPLEGSGRQGALQEHRQPRNDASDRPFRGHGVCARRLVAQTLLHAAGRLLPPAASAARPHLRLDGRPVQHLDDPPRTRTGLSVRPRLSGVADRKSLIRWNASRSA